tara:strand:+ start:135 stop:491 length:357 start_codon:yes stop_codon:yes gene_type:complete
MSPIEKTEEECEKEANDINEIFGDTEFTICVPIEELDHILTTGKKLHIEISGLFTYDNKNCFEEITSHFIMNKPTGNITQKDAIFHLKQQGFKPRGDHVFLEVFHKIKKNHFSVFMGS